MTPELLQERENRLRRAFLENDFGEASDRLNNAAEVGIIENKEQFLKASAVAGWAGSQMNRPVNPTSPDWQGIKDGIARGYFKKKDAKNVTDDELFAQIAADYKAQDAAFEAAKDAAARGESWLGKFREKEAALPEMAGGRQTSYLGMTRQVHDAFRAKIAQYQTTIASVAQKARSIQGPEGADYGSMADELIKIPKEDRPFVLEAISRQIAAKDETGAAQNLMINFDRGIERYLDTAVSGLERFGESQVGRFMRAAQGFDIQAQTPEEVERRAQYLDLRDDMRGIATGKLSKLNDVRLLGMNLSGAARNAAMTLGAFVPYVGPAAMVSSFARETANEIRQQNPTMSRADAEQIAMVSAPFQAATEVISDRLLFGKLPSLKRVFTMPVFSAGGIAGQLATRVGVATGTELAEELAQGTIPRVIQALKDDVPAVDWDGYFEDFKDQAPEMISEILPMALLGAGVGQLSDYRAGHELIKNRDLLVAAKLTTEDADAIAGAAESGDFDKAELLLRTAWPKVAAQGQAPSEVRDNAVKSFLTRSQAVRQEQERATAEAEAIGVAVIRDAEGWKVRLSDGSVIPADSAEAANRMQKDMAMAASEYEAETMVAAVDEMLKQQPGRRFEVTAEVAQAGDNGLVFTNPITGQVREIKDEASLQNLRDEQMALAKKEGEEPAAALILGMNRFEFGNGIISVFQRGLNKDGTADVPRIITAMHEQIEASWRKGIVTGQFSEAESRAAVANLMSQLDVAKLGKSATDQEKAWFERAATVARGEGDENLLREVISELAVRTWIGRDRRGDKTGLRQGTVLRALDAAVLKAKQPAEMSMMKRIRAWFKAVGAYLRGVVATAKQISKAEQSGTVTDYTEFMDKLLGLTESRREDMAQAEQIKQQMEDDGMAFSLSPTSSADQLAQIIESIMQSRPDLAFKIRQRSLADIGRLIQNWSTERVTWKGDKVRPVVEKRTKASLDKEQAMLEAVRYSELLDSGMDTLTPETLMAWSEGVGKLEQHPLIQQMLGAHGRLMSKSTAESFGKLKTDGKGKAGDYDGAGWIPPKWYAGSAGGIMPDVMAQNLYDDGLLNEPTPDALWQALDSVVTTHRAAKTEYAKAEAAVKSVEKQAKEKAKAEAAAWRQETEDMMDDDWSPRESLQRDARLFNTAMAAFPAEIRAKIVPGGMVKLAGLATERARYKVIEKAMQKAVVELEKFMRKEITAEVDKLLERYSPQKDKSGRITGKLLADYTELIGYADFIKSASIEDQAKESDALEKAIENGESAEIVQDALNKIGVLRLFETWATKDSIAQSAALDWINAIIADGKMGKKILDEERKAFLDDLRGNATADILEGAEVSLTEANNITNAVQSSVWRKLVQNMRGMVNSMLLNTAQRLESIFGENSKVTDYFVPKLIETANRSTDIKRDIDRKRRDALTVVFNTSSTLAHARGIARLQKPKQSGIFITEGRKTEEVKLDIDTLTKLSDGTMTAEAAGLRQDQVNSALEEWASSERKRTVTVEKVLNAGTQRELFTSEMKGIQWLLWSRQDASRAQMERDGWTGESFKQLDEFLSPEAKLLADWMALSYADAPKLIDPVYRRLFNAPLPRVKNYAPIYRHRQGEANILDLDGSDISSGLAAGFTKSRVNTVSPLMELDAMAVFLAHWENVAHWVSHAEVMRDARAVLLDSKTRTAIRQKKGDASLKNLQEDVTKIEGNGTDKARELVFLSGFWNNLMQYRAFKGLAWRISPVVKQASAVLNPLLADVPAHAYAMGLARAFSDPVGFSKDVAAMWKSDIIRRRVEGGFSAEARIAMQGQGMNSSMLLAMMQKGMMPMAEMDAGWTALGASISFDYYRRSYIKENPGTTDELADSYASKQLDKMIATSAQPADIMNRALIERSSNRFMKALWMFASESRKALAIEVMAIRRLATGRSKNKLLDLQRVAVAHVLQAAVTQLSTAILASMIGDPEDEEREWSQEQWASSLALGPIGGLFVFGRAIEMSVDRLLGLRVFRDSGMIDKAMEDVYKGAKNINDLFSDDPDDVTAEIDRLSTATGAVLSGLFGPAGGAADVMGNIAREAKKVSDAVQRE